MRTRSLTADANIAMNRLVQTATRDWLRKYGVSCLEIRRVADQFGKLFPDNSHDKRGLWREYLTHALVLAHENDFIPQLK
ncbi:uncharacterized protein BO80DRAFT_485751 [Aspergillus ibericus CBS 121593]|uniref:Uncharacterized protein n=1 Tax=Aspergillus ibericus CBS 121593 TaxID=1448316 RepID=A0A395GKD3_9EURO|nr:hypothetical protein BO80DRAFT_485751 [Aspergillus ibericus CBS 121593]RAK95945.1 hypothetical protein BO80DRAFT_485751 [Aspergillus ibericus CBS 121593]